MSRCTSYFPALFFTCVSQCFDIEDVQPAQEAEEEPSDPIYGTEGYYGSTVLTDETDALATTEPEIDQTSELTGISSRCVNISFGSDTGAFLEGRRYTLILPAETQYSNEAGSLKDDTRIDFGGLRDFRIPFVQEKNFQINSSRLHLWLPHGLGEGVDVTDFPLRIARAGNNGQEVDFFIRSQ